MKKVLIFIYKLMYFTIPIPLFYDFGKFELVVRSFESYGKNTLTDGPTIPIPIGVIGFLIATLIGYLCSVVYPKSFRSVLPPSKMVLFYSWLVLPLYLYTTYISELSTVRFIQLVLPMLFISILSLPTRLEDRADLVKIILLSSSLFFFLHFLSILIYAENPLKVNDTPEYSNFFGILIYQSLVTYPAVLTLYLYLNFAFIYATKKSEFYHFKKFNYISYILIFIILYLAAGSGRKAFLIEYTGSIIVVILLVIFYICFNRYVKKKTAWLVFLFITLFISSYIFYVNSALSERLFISLRTDTFDSGRADILKHSVNFYSDNLSIFLFGGGERERPGFHNFILDQIYRVGITGLITVYVSTIFLVKRFVKAQDLGTNYPFQRRAFLLMVLLSLFIQSMVNSSVTQPYYFINVITVGMMIYFVLFSSGAERSTCISTRTA